MVKRSVKKDVSAKLPCMFRQISRIQRNRQVQKRYGKIKQGVFDKKPPQALLFMRFVPYVRCKDEIAACHQKERNSDSAQAVSQKVIGILAYGRKRRGMDCHDHTGGSEPEEVNSGRVFLGGSNGLHKLLLRRKQATNDFFKGKSRRHQHAGKTAVGRKTRNRIDLVEIDFAFRR